MKDFLMKIKKERSIRDRIAFFFFLSFLNDIEKEDEEKGRRKWRKRYFSIESRLIFERTIETDNRLNKKKILRIKLEKKKKKKEIFWISFFHESPPVCCWFGVKVCTSKVFRLWNTRWNSIDCDVRDIRRGRSMRARVNSINTDFIENDPSNHPF